jgi:hypothetical protein
MVVTIFISVWEKTKAPDWVVQRRHITLSEHMRWSRIFFAKLLHFNGAPYQLGSWKNKDLSDLLSDEEKEDLTQRGLDFTKVPPCEAVSFEPHTTLMFRSFSVKHKGLASENHCSWSNHC